MGEKGRENETFRSLDMRTLISKWEDRAGGGEGRNELPLPTVEGGGRRKSQDFTELILKFTDQGKKDNELELSARKLDIRSSTKLSFTTLGRGAVRKLSYNYQQSVVGREGMPLARSSANRKRKCNTHSGDTNPKRHCGL